MRIGRDVRELNHIESAQDIEENLRDLLHRCELAPVTAKKALDYILKAGKQPMCTPFDLESLNLLLEWGIANIKISSMDLNNIILHQRLSRCQLPLNVYISTGMSSFDEIKIVSNIYKHTPHAITFMLCNSSYPTPDSEVDLRGISRLLELGFSVGYSDHTIGLEACVAAAALGASCLEVHFTDNKFQSGPDQLISKTADELIKLKQRLFKQSSLLGTCSLGYRPSEYSTWRSQKKSLYAKVDLAVGSKVTLENTFLASPPLGISPLSLYSEELIVGTQISAGAPVTRSSLRMQYD